MGEILSLQVVVEGIETAGQAAIISTFGNVRGQGFLLARPMGAEAAERFIADAVARWDDNAAQLMSALRRPRLVTAADQPNSAPRAS